MKKSVFIIGLGRFGKNLALNLLENDVDVIIADMNEKVLQEFAESNGIDNAKILDSTNSDALDAAGVTKVNQVVVAMADIECSLLTCANLKELGVKNLMAKAQNPIHSKLLKAIGVQNVVFPEKDSAIITAQQILYDDITIIKQSKEITILSVSIKDNKFVGKHYYEIEDGTFKIFAVKHNQINTSLIYDIDQNLLIEKLDRLYIICENNKLKNIMKIFKEEKPKSTTSPKAKKIFKTRNR